jgi:hypothetical protein
MEDNITFSTKVAVFDMYKFKMKHAYHGLQGIISILISITALVIYFIFRSKIDDPFLIFALLVTGLWFTVLIPFRTMRIAMSTIALSPVFHKPLEYNLCDEGIKVSQEGDEALLPWDCIIEVHEKLGQLCIYSSPLNGYIIPKKQVADKYESIKNYIVEHVDKEVCVVK